MSLLNVDVCFSPAIYSLHHKSDSIVVVVDILRATSAICSAFMNGVEEIIPVGNSEEAREYKKKGFLVAAERDGLVLDFADFGNSPFNFTNEKVGGKCIVYSTTNGTKAIDLAKGSAEIVIGSYLNLSALSKWLVNQNKSVVIFCSGWKDRFSLEDTVFAGALVEKLLLTGKYSTICDAANASFDLWQIAKPDLHSYSLKVAQKARLAQNGLDDVFEFCHTLDQMSIIPLLKNGRLIGVTPDN